MTQRGPERPRANGALRTRSSQLAVAIVVLLVAAAPAFRILRRPPTASPAVSEPTGPLETQSHVRQSPLPAEASAGSLALRWVTLVSERPGTFGRAEPQLELERSRERELAANLRRQLDQDPERWCDVLEIVSGEDPRAGRRVVGELRNGVGASAEPVLIRLLRDSASREARMEAATLLAVRDSTGSFWALHAAAQQDPDPGVRFHALNELTVRQRSSQPSEAAAIDELVKSRARVESDPEVRAFAQRLCGEAPPSSTAVIPVRNFAGHSGIRLH